MPEKQYEPGYTRRTTCGEGRATYHPEWSKDYPWILYVRGEAKRQAQTLYQAKISMKKYYSLDLIDDINSP